MKTTLIALLTLASLTSFGQTSVRGQKVTVENTTVTVSVTLTSSPSSVTVKYADLKYNKQGVFQFELDDNSKGIRDVYAMWHGGKAQDSTLYVGKTFTDGCGNPVLFRAGIAVNGRGGFLNNEISAVTNSAFNATYAEIAALVNEDWALENHSFYHDPTTRYSYKYDAGRNVRELHNLFRSKLKTYGADYVIRTLVAPTNWTNFERAADSLGYLAATSTGQRDGYTLYPASGQTYFGTETLPIGFVSFGRVVDDTWSTATVSASKATFDGIVSGSSSSTHKMWRLFSHGPQNVANFLDFTNYIAANNQDKIWICTMHEQREYDEVKRLAMMSQSLSGNVLTLTINLARVPAINRFQDMSLLLSGATISAVSVTNADSYSINTTTGLINLFKKKTAGFPPATY